MSRFLRGLWVCASLVLMYLSADVKLALVSAILPTLRDLTRRRLGAHGYGCSRRPCGLRRVFPEIDVVLQTSPAAQGTQACRVGYIQFQDSCASLSV